MDDAIFGSDDELAIVPVAQPAAIVAAPARTRARRIPRHTVGGLSIFVIVVPFPRVGYFMEFLFESKRIYVHGGAMTTAITSSIGCKLPSKFSKPLNTY